MKTILAIAFTSLLTSTAFAQDVSKAEQRAQFSMKVATCKASAKTDGVKSSTAQFYGYMGACLDRVTVAVNVAPAK